MAIKIHAIRTGSVRVKTAQRVRRPGGLVRVLADSTWTDWLPIYAWAIEHPDGVIVVDTGETSKSMEPGYYPRWHPYYRGSLRMDVKPEEEIGPQLRELGIRPADIRTVVLTHFHTDHAGGLHHFPDTEILVSGEDWALARGFMGRLLGYLPHRWPSWFSPTPVAFEDGPEGPFGASSKLTEAGDVIIVPTPGHTPNHQSVIVRSDEVSYFLAGDTTYLQDLLVSRRPDGVSPKPAVTLETIGRILGYGGEFDTVYLPSHDPEALDRLETRQVLPKGT